MPSEPTAPDGAPIAPADSNADTPPRRKRRRGRKLLIAAGVLALVLVALVAALPILASTRVVLNLALSQANARLRGVVSAQALSASWFGPLELRGVRVLDAGQREVLAVERVACSRGLWHLLTAPLEFGEVHVQRASIALILDESGAMTIADAFGSRAPSTSSDTTNGPLPRPRGALRLDDVRLTVARPRAATIEISDLDGSANLDTLSRLDGKFAAVLASGGRFETEVAIRDLVRNDVFDWTAASGELRLASPQPIQLAPLIAMSEARAQMSGSATLRAEAALARGAISGTLRLDVASLQARLSDGQTVESLDASLTATATTDESGLRLDANVTSAAGEAHADLHYPLAGAGPAFDFDALLASLLTGEGAAMPDLRLDASADVDLAALGRSVPGLLRLRADQAIVGGRLSATGVALRGGDEPSIRGVVQTSDVAIDRGGQRVTLTPWRLSVDARSASGRGIELGPTELSSSFARVVASGSAADLRAQFDCDLARLQRELEELFDLGDLELGGVARGELHATRASDRDVKTQVSAEATGLRVGVGPTTFDLPKAALQSTSLVKLANGSLSRVEVDALRVDLNGQVVASAKGWYDAGGRAFQAVVDAERVDLQFAADRAAALGSEELERFGGTIAGRASISQDGGGQAIRSEGTLRGEGLTLDGKPIDRRPVQIAWSGAEIDPARASAQFAAARIEGTFALVAANSLRIQTGDGIGASGDVEVRADLGECGKLASALAKSASPPQIDGKLRWKAQLVAEGERVRIDGAGEIGQLVVGSGDSAVREEKVDLALSGALDNAARTIRIERAAMQSGLLTAEASGDVREFDRQAALDLRGQYDASWPAITALLHELAPGTSKLVSLRGRSRAEFVANGPLNRAEDDPPFRGLTASTELAWRSADLAGLEVGEAKLTPRLKDGVLTLPRTELAASGGTIRLGGQLNFRRKDPTLTIDKRLVILEKVPITPVLGSELLSRINPIFLQMTRIEGDATLAVQDLVFPLGESVKRRGAGTGRLDLRTIRIQPGGLMADLIALGGFKNEEMYTVRVGALDFAIVDGRVKYDNFALIFPEDFDLRFHGSVGLDDSLDLVVSIPIRPALLKKLGVQGPVLEYAKALSKARVDVPIVGTRQNPGIDLKRVDTRKLVEAALQNAPQEALGGLLDLLGGERDKPDDPKKPGGRRGGNKEDPKGGKKPGSDKP